MHAERERSGVTLVEMMIVVAVLGILAAVAGPGIDDWFANQRVRSAANSVADLFLIARAEAIRTGNAHIVFLSAAPGGGPPATDPLGTPLPPDPSTGGVFPAVIIDDGSLAAANCAIDAGELRHTLGGERGVAWGFAVSGGVLVPSDSGGGNIADGSSFQTAAGVGTTWVMFRPDGLPVSFDAACNRGGVGSGGGAIYVTNGQRDYAIVLAPLGGVRVHVWDAGAGAWSS